MLNSIKRLQLNFDSTNAVVKTAINVELGIIDALGGNVISYKEYYSKGVDKLIIDIEYVISYVNDKSLLIDGINQCVNIDTVRTALATTTVGSLLVWIKPIDATPSTLETIIGFGDNSASEWIDFSINPIGTLRILCRDAGVNQYVLDTDNPVFTDNTWTHIAITQDGVSPVLYVNGVAVAQAFINQLDKTAWFNRLTGLDNGRIGALKKDGGGNINLFNGNIDEPLFVNRALTSNQVLDVYNGGTPKDESGISNGVAYYLMGDEALDNFDGTNWNFKNVLGANYIQTINCVNGSVVNDTP